MYPTPIFWTQKIIEITYVMTKTGLKEQHTNLEIQIEHLNPPK